METLADQIIQLGKSLENTSMNVGSLINCVGRLQKSQLTFNRKQTQLNDEIIMIKMQLDCLQTQVFRFEEIQKKLFQVCVGLFCICLFLLARLFSQ
jgi:hypothetical protein